LRFFVRHAFVFLVILLAGCDSDHEVGVSIDDPVVHRPNPAIVDSALYCVVTGIATKNTTLYGYALPDTLQDGINFHAFFDPQDLADYAQAGNTPPSDWTTPDEKTFISQYVTLVPVSKYDVVTTPDANRADVLGPDETIYYRHYRVSFGTPPHFIGVGVAGLYFRRVGVNQDWKRTRWVDHRDTTAVGVRTIGRQRLGPPTVGAANEGAVPLSMQPAPLSADGMTANEKRRN